jgi:hypothetical protein
MSKAAVVDWTDAELALLREHYSTLGAPGVLTAVADAPRVVNPDECRPWARVVAGAVAS